MVCIVQDVDLANRAYKLEGRSILYTNSDQGPGQSAFPFLFPFPPFCMRIAVEYILRKLVRNGSSITVAVVRIL